MQIQIQDEIHIQIHIHLTLNYCMFTILNFRLNIIITHNFLLRSVRSKAERIVKCNRKDFRAFLINCSVNFVISESIPGNSHWFDRTTLNYNFAFRIFQISFVVPSQTLEIFEITVLHLISINPESWEIKGDTESFHC